MCIEYIWEIIPKETPVVEKNCTRCNNNQFICSEKFRVNSNKKMSDVWLIYKCFHCENTWKMSILTRKNLSQMDHDLFCQFQENNVDLAWHYAFDKSMAKNNKVRMNGNVKIDIVDRTGDFLQSNEKMVSILMTSKYELTISIKKILQQKLQLSANQVEKLNQNEIIMINEDKNHDLSKKIGLGCRLLINVANWKIVKV